MARHKKNQYKRKRKGHKTYSIIVDGKTEVWYFQMLKKHETLAKIDIKPTLPKETALDELYTRVIEDAKMKVYDKVIWIVDMDQIMSETRKTRSGERTALQRFKEYKENVKKLPKDYSDIEILVNTPCLEFWLLLHFEDTGKYYPKCKGAEDALKKTYLKDYEKTERYYKKANNDIYKKLRSKLETGIVNAHKRGRFDIENPASAKAEIYRLFCLLKISEVSPDCDDKTLSIPPSQ